MKLQQIHHWVQLESNPGAELETRRKTPNRKFWWRSRKGTKFLLEHQTLLHPNTTECWVHHQKQFRLLRNKTGRKLCSALFQNIWKKQCTLSFEWVGWSWLKFCCACCKTHKMVSVAPEVLNLEKRNCHGEKSQGWTLNSSGVPWVVEVWSSFDIKVNKWKQKDSSSLERLVCLAQPSWRNQRDERWVGAQDGSLWVQENKAVRRRLVSSVDCFTPLQSHSDCLETRSKNNTNLHPVHTRIYTIVHVDVHFMENKSTTCVCRYLGRWFQMCERPGSSGNQNFQRLWNLSVECHMHNQTKQTTSI